MDAEDPLVAMLDRLAEALQAQRQGLEAGQYDRLAEVNSEVAARYAAVESWPGGFEALRAEIASRPSQQSAALRDRLQALATENRICGDLIRIAMQRAAALHAFRTAATEAGTYGPGASAGLAARRVSRRA